MWFSVAHWISYSGLDERNGRTLGTVMLALQLVRGDVLVRSAGVEYTIGVQQLAISNLQYACVMATLVLS